LLVCVFIHLMYIEPFQSRILSLVQWGIPGLMFIRGAWLIAGTGEQRILTSIERLRSKADC